LAGTQGESQNEGKLMVPEKSESATFAAEHRPMHDLGVVDDSEFVPTGEALAAETLRQKNESWQNSAVAALLENSPAEKTGASYPRLQSILSWLDAHGFKRLHSRLRAGSYALVLEAENHQMVRIVPVKDEAPRPYLPYMLQPIMSEEVDGFRVEVLPKVLMFNDIMASVNTEHNLVERYGMAGGFSAALARIARRLMVDAAHDGYMLWDPNSSNIGVIKDAAGNIVPVVVDGGSLVDVGKLTPAQVDVLYDALSMIEGGSPSLAALVRSMPSARKLSLPALTEELKKIPATPAREYWDAQAAHVQSLEFKPDGIETGGMCSDATPEPGASTKKWEDLRSPQGRYVRRDPAQGVHSLF
jgi:hypothetical protein